MTTTMVGPAMLTVLIHIFLVSHGVQCSEPDGAASLHSGAVDIPWQDELCCDSPPAHLSAETSDAHASETNRSVSSLQYRPHCNFRSSATQSAPTELPHGTCLEILCRIDENGENLTCDLQSHDFPLSTWHMAVSLERVLSQTEADSGKKPDNVVVCEAEDSFTCSVALSANTGSVSVVISSDSTAVAQPVRLRVPVKPSPPVNLSHNQTIEAELILRWDPPKAETRPLIYEVRYARKAAHPTWQVVSALAEPKLALDLEPKHNYSTQVRCSSLEKPPRWSDWSEPHHIRLNSEIIYIPEVVVVRPGEMVTVYCVFNNRNANASTATWMLNLRTEVHSSKYQAVNQWVSKVTLQASENRMFDLLQCKTSTDSYSSIYIDGASINISCRTNGDIDAMDCHWENPGMEAVSFHYSWAEMDCDVMEERERAGEKVGEIKENVCHHSTCKIHPLSMNCYKVWLEMSSKQGPVKSKPIYLSPIDHVKPNAPTNVEAVSQSNGFLNVTWTAPELPIHCRCQFQYRTMSTVRAQLEWKVQREVLVSHAVVKVEEMCRVYEVQVRCKHEQGTGEWSEWSKSKFSKAQNDNAPERGPDFWRILQDHPDRNQTHVTLLLQPVHISGAHCVDGFVVQRQTSSGSVIRQEIEVKDSYSFEWDQLPQTVTVEAYNNLGRSAHNFNMTLEKQPKRRCVQSFSVLVINSTFVSLSWTLLDNTSGPIFMVVQWFPQKQQDSNHHRGQSRDNWARLPYSERPTYLRVNFLGPEEYDYYLFPVLADRECEPVYATATRRDPAAYMLLMIISFLSFVLFVSLLLSQNQMKKFVWKDVPNPNKCSWAKGVDFKKTDNFGPLFRTTEDIPAWPLFPPCEDISNVVIVDKADLSALTTALIETPTVSVTLDPTTSIALPPELDQATQSEAPCHPLSLDTLTCSDSTDTSAQSSVTYATVLLSDPKREQLPIHLHIKDTSGSSSSDEGNFSANNSDISGSLHGGLWELDNPRRSCSYNSVEKLSETSEQGDEDEDEDEDEGVREEKELYYLGMDYPAEDEESDEEEEQDSVGTKTELLKNVVLTREARSELHPLLGPEESSELLSPSACGLSPLYLPQFRTVQPQDAV